jgi:dihydrolipoamide dehydrogenase
MHLEPIGFVADLDRAIQLAPDNAMYHKWWDGSAWGPSVTGWEYMGGVCLNWGCIPSKALIAAAGLVDRIRRAEVMGIRVEGLDIDVGEMQRWKGEIVKKLTGGVSMLVRGNKGTIVMGTARIKSPTSVEVTKQDGQTEVYEANKGIIVATGAEPIRLPGIEIDGEVVITAREAVSLTKVP